MGLGRSTPFYQDLYHSCDTFVNQAEWRKAVVRMNHSRPVSMEKEIVNVGYLFGTQPYYVFAIHDSETKELLRAASHDQPSITACNCIFVFCARKDIEVTNHFPVIMQTPKRWWNVHEPSILDWVTRQTYIALGFVIAACSEESIPCSPIDEFQASRVSAILALPDHLIPTCILTLGAPD